jgi:hypothetical protein
MKWSKAEVVKTIEDFLEGKGGPAKIQFSSKSAS